ncbi:MAG: VWA domain-containing protein [Sulfurovum sp.]|nr:VWA domain-containing protein [Sulfurovum sp.]
MRRWGILLYMMMTYSQANTPITILLDASKSMNVILGDSSKIQMVQRALLQVLGEKEHRKQVGLSVFGQDKSKGCRDIRHSVPLAKAEKNYFFSTLASIKPQGKSGILYALKELAIQRDYEYKQSKIILIADGRDSCYPNPCAMAGLLKSKAKDLQIDVIGINVNKRAKKQLECIAKITEGEYWDIGNERAFIEALEAIVQRVEVKVMPLVRYTPVSLPRRTPNRIPLLTATEDNITVEVEVDSVIPPSYNVHILATQKGKIKEIAVKGYMYRSSSKGKITEGKVWVLKPHILDYYLPLGRYKAVVEYDSLMKEVSFEVLASRVATVEIEMGQTGRIGIHIEAKERYDKEGFYGYIYLVDTKGEQYGHCLEQINAEEPAVFYTYRLPIGKYIFIGYYQGIKKGTPFEVYSDTSTRVSIDVDTFFQE